MTRGFAAHNRCRGRTLAHGGFDAYAQRPVGQAGRTHRSSNALFGALVLGGFTVALVVVAIAVLVGEPDQTNRAQVGIGLLTGAVVSAVLAVAELLLATRQHATETRARGERDRQALILLLGADRNLDGIDLSGRDLAGIFLRNKSMRHARLVGTVLRDADLSGTDLTGANLLGADLAGSTLSGTRFDHAVLCGARFDAASTPPPRTVDSGHADVDVALAERAEAMARELNIVELDQVSALTGMLSVSASFRGANLAGALFRSALLRGADMRETNLSGAQIHEADLEFVDLSNSTIRISLSSIEIRDLCRDARVDPAGLVKLMKSEWSCRGDGPDAVAISPSFETTNTNFGGCSLGGADIAPELQHVFDPMEFAAGERSTTP